MVVSCNSPAYLVAEAASESRLYLPAQSRRRVWLTQSQPCWHSRSASRTGTCWPALSVPIWSQVHAASDQSTPQASALSVLRIFLARLTKAVLKPCVLAGFRGASRRADAPGQPAALAAGPHLAIFNFAVG